MPSEIVDDQPFPTMLAPSAEHALELRTLSLDFFWHFHHPHFSPLSLSKSDSGEEYNLFPESLVVVHNGL